MNPFLKADAGLYARARPRYQTSVLTVAAEILGLDPARPVDLAVDVGCGTGHSSTALAPWARRVIGLDVATTMLAAAEPAAGVSYLAAAAERLPLRSGLVDIVTVGAVFHWLDGAAFLAEACRALHHGGMLVSYSDFFNGSVREAPEVASWVRERYIPRHPSPRRGRHLSPDIAAANGFEVVGQQELENGFVMDVGEFADYLLTQSNALATLSSDAVTAAELRASIVVEVAPLFPSSQVGTVVFGARVLCLRSPT